MIVMPQQRHAMTPMKTAYEYSHHWTRVDGRSISQKRMGVFIVALALSLWAAPAQAQATLAPDVFQQFFDSNGDPLAGGRICVFEAGTSTLATTYLSNTVDAGNAQTNPIVLNSAGRPSSGASVVGIWLAPGSAYKFVLKDSTTTTCVPDTGVTLVTIDNVQSVPGSSVNVDITGTAGEALTEGDLVYKSDGSGGLNAGSWYKADADQTYSSTLPVLGFAIADIGSGDSGTIRTGGQITLTGPLSTSAAGYYVSAAAGGITTTAPTNARFVGAAQSTTVLDIEWRPETLQRLTVLSTSATSIDTAGGINAGSGNVGIVDTTGKIPALTSTYLAALSGQSLTGIPVLLYANSGTTTNAAAENVDTYALASQLTAKDTLLVYVTGEAVTQQTASVNLYNSTDAVAIVDVWDSGLGAMGAGRENIMTMTLRQLQSAATAVMASGTGANDNAAAIQTGAASTFVTNWTGAWSLALRQGGVTAGGTFRWSWAIYRVRGQ